MGLFYTVLIGTEICGGAISLARAILFRYNENEAI